MDNTYESRNRNQFADVVKALRSVGALKTYGRDAQFGRVAIARNNHRYVLTTWVRQSRRLNLHFKGGM